MVNIEIIQISICFTVLPSVFALNLGLREKDEINSEINIAKELNDSSGFFFNFTQSVFL